MKEEQAKRLEPLYPKWVQFKNEKTLRLVPEQVAIMGQVWSELTNKRWSGGCQACTVNAFSQVMTIYDAYLDKLYQEQHQPIEEPAFTENEPTEIVNNKKQENAVTKKRTRRIQK
jgi:hypothetical protein